PAGPPQEGPAAPSGWKALPTTHSLPPIASASRGASFLLVASKIVLVVVGMRFAREHVGRCRSGSSPSGRVVDRARMKNTPRPGVQDRLSLDELRELAALWEARRVPGSTITRRDLDRARELETRLVCRYVLPAPGTTGWSGVIDTTTGEVVEDHGPTMRPPRRAA